MAASSDKILRFAAIVVLSCSLLLTTVESSQLKLGFYSYTCPQAEKIVRKAVEKAVSKNPGFAAGLIRMHFHDCFVRGCDGSLLLDSVPGRPTAEKDHPANFPSLRGFEVIDEAKALVEAACPKTVSCADILAFAARDSVLRTGQIWYDVPSGRRDGRLSLASEVALPPPFLNAAQLQDNFKAKGLSLDEMVTLSGAHSIGVSHCSSFANRLSGFNATFDRDPSLHPGYGAFLRTRCPAGPVPGVNDPAVSNDVFTPGTLDNKYYLGLKDGKGLLTSDQTLFESAATRGMVVANARYGAVWGKKFAAAMVKMGEIEVLTGNQGEIRRNCRVINY